MQWARAAVRARGQSHAAASTYSYRPPARHRPPGEAIADSMQCEIPRVSLAVVCRCPENVQNFSNRLQIVTSIRSSIHILRRRVLVSVSANRSTMPRSPVGASTGDMWSTWGGAAGEIRCGRCGTVLKGSERHTCAIVQQRTPKVETSPLAQTLLRRADTCHAPAAPTLAPTQADGAPPAQATNQGARKADRHAHEPKVEPLADSQAQPPCMGSKADAGGGEATERGHG